MNKSSKILHILPKCFNVDQHLVVYFKLLAKLSCLQLFAGWVNIFLSTYPISFLSGIISSLLTSNVWTTKNAFQGSARFVLQHFTNRRSHLLKSEILFTFCCWHERKYVNLPTVTQILLLGHSRILVNRV